MSKFHETPKNSKKAPKKSLKERRAEKREKKAMKGNNNDIRKIFEEAPK